LKLLLDEMYSPVLARDLRAAGVDVNTVAELGLAGSSDAEVFSASLAQDRVVLTENIADFARIFAEHLAAGHRHPGVLIALSSRFSRRPAGIGAIVAAVLACADLSLEDRLVYLESAGRGE
jgi:predicted nuclease of predicted toxin-antitoxin system